MKAKRYPESKVTEPDVLRDQPDAMIQKLVEPSGMHRTQIYLSVAEHQFVQAEAARRGEPMAAVIRSFIDEKMRLPDDAWTNNPMLQSIPDDVTTAGPEDGAINRHHHLFGAPKSRVKQDGKWVEAPPLPEDYFDNPATAAAYDAMIARMEKPQRGKARG